MPNFARVLDDGAIVAGVPKSTTAEKVDAVEVQLAIPEEQHSPDQEHSRGELEQEERRQQQEQHGQISDYDDGIEPVALMPKFKRILLDGGIVSGNIAKQQPQVDSEDQQQQEEQEIVFEKADDDETEPGMPVIVMPKSARVLRYGGIVSGKPKPTGKPLKVKTKAQIPEQQPKADGDDETDQPVVAMPIFARILRDSGIISGNIAKQLSSKQLQDDSDSEAQMSEEEQDDEEEQLKGDDDDDDDDEMEQPVVAKPLFARILRDSGIISGNIAKQLSSKQLQDDSDSEAQMSDEEDDEEEEQQERYVQKADGKEKPTFAMPRFKRILLDGGIVSGKPKSSAKPKPSQAEIEAQLLSIPEEYSEHSEEMELEQLKANWEKNAMPSSRMMLSETSQLPLHVDPEASQLLAIPEELSEQLNAENEKEPVESKKHLVEEKRFFGCRFCCHHRRAVVVASSVGMGMYLLLILWLESIAGTSSIAMVVVDDDDGWDDEEFVADRRIMIGCIFVVVIYMLQCIAVGVLRSKNVRWLLILVVLNLAALAFGPWAATEVWFLSKDFFLDDDSRPTLEYWAWIIGGTAVYGVFFLYPLLGLTVEVHRYRTARAGSLAAAAAAANNTSGGNTSGGEDTVVVSSLEINDPDSISSEHKNATIEAILMARKSMSRKFKYGFRSDDERPSQPETEILVDTMAMVMVQPTA